MRLTNRSEYALLALVHLARREHDGWIPAQTIAEAQQIPPKFLEQILLTLRLAKLVRSQRGKAGGYCLARKADRIHLAEVVRLFDGALAPTESVSKYFYESTPIEGEKGLLRVFREIRDFVADRLEHTTLADVR
ncbi:MAG: Rrf2 family transcriptional regulator [Planctomycetes bacterium]|nr:Rrf2 family transcriptional regulator [Planctomycetota bacterium]